MQFIVTLLIHNSVINYRKVSPDFILIPFVLLLYTLSGIFIRFDIPYKPSFTAQRLQNRMMNQSPLNIIFKVNSLSILIYRLRWPSFKLIKYFIHIFVFFIITFYQLAILSTAMNKDFRLIYVCYYFVSVSKVSVIVVRSCVMQLEM